MYSEVAWVLVSSETQVQPQIILEPHYLPDYLSVSYDYEKSLQIDSAVDVCSSNFPNFSNLLSNKKGLSHVHMALN